MLIKKEKFAEIYLLDNPEKISDKQYNNLLMAGKINYEQYFLPFKTMREFEVLKGVELIEFSNATEMFNFIKKLNPFHLINYSLEHDNPCVLKFIF